MEIIKNLDIEIDKIEKEIKELTCKLIAINKKAKVKFKNTTGIDILSKNYHDPRLKALSHQDFSKAIHQAYDGEDYEKTRDLLFAKEECRIKLIREWMSLKNCKK